MAIALLSGSERGLVAGLSVPGVAGGGIFRRQSSDEGTCVVGIFELESGQAPSGSRLAEIAASTGATTVATFTRLSEYRNKEGRSDLSRANAVLLVLVSNREPSLDAAFNRWYDDTHLPDVVNAGGFWIGTRYRSDTDGRYLAVYESDMADSALARAGITSAVPKMVLWPHLEQLHVAGYGRVAP